MDHRAGSRMVEMNFYEMSVPSSDVKHKLSGFVCEPAGEILGHVQIIHGMTDYTLRYRDLMEKLARTGYLAFGYDQLGHGHTATSNEELGFISAKDGWKFLVEDATLFYQAICQKYGKAPFAILGHSMGSFVARLAALSDFPPQKLILVGSGTGDAASPLGRMMANVIQAFRGEKHISHFMQGIVFSDFDKPFEGDWPNRWVTVDTENLVRYKDDPFCTFRFTISALRDLITLNEKADSISFYKKLSPETSVLLLSGSEDPVGGRGKGIRKISRRLERNGKKSRFILYDGFRHEILQDFCKDQVAEDILAFLKEE